MESIQELIRKLCKCIVKSDDGLDYITISKQETPTPPTPPEPEKPDLNKFDPNVPFCIENVGDEPVVFCAYNHSGTARSYCEISYDNKTWKPYELKNSSNLPPTDISKISLIVLANKGDRVYFKMDDYTNTTGNTKFYFLNDNQGIKVRARGNIASLNHGRNEVYKTNYLEIDEIHAGCYANMFRKCTSLIQAPDLPAPIISNRQDYQEMFYGCKSLNYIKCLATEVMNSSGSYIRLSNWVYGVSSTGDFYTPKDTLWRIAEDGIPSGWTCHDII